MQAAETDELIESLAAAPQFAPEQQRQQDDLEAQQEMAFWAMAMFFATVATVMITAIGVWLVKRTLDETIKAVQDTSEATDAMREANDIARETSLQQLRPYLGTPGAVVAYAGSANPRVIIDIQNFGQTPASIIKQDFRVIHIARQQDRSMKRIFYRCPLGPTGHCDPGHAQSRTAVLEGPLSFMQDDHVYAELTITYQSASNRVYWRRMSYVANRNSLDVAPHRIRMDVHETSSEDGEGQPPVSDWQE